MYEICPERLDADGMARNLVESHQNKIRDSIADTRQMTHPCNVRDHCVRAQAQERQESPGFRRNRAACPASFSLHPYCETGICAVAVRVKLFDDMKGTWIV